MTFVLSLTVPHLSFLWCLWKAELRDSCIFKAPLQEGLPEPEVYSDLVYKFRRVVGSADLSGQLK